MTSQILRGHPKVEISRTSRSANADLIVLGRHGRRPVRDMFIGTTAVRVFRQSDVPVLVVTLEPTHPCRHPVIATALEDSCRRTVDLALRVLGADTRLVNVVHAFHVPFEGFVMPSCSAREESEWRRSYQETAVAGMTQFLSLVPRTYSSAASPSGLSPLRPPTCSWRGQSASLSSCRDAAVPAL